jgi:hypothetical protein
MEMPWVIEYEEWTTSFEEDSMSFVLGVSMVEGKEGKAALPLARGVFDER